MAGSFHLLQLFPDAHHAVHQHPPVKFDLAFTRPAQKAAPAALAFKMRPAADKPAALESQCRQLDLQPAGMGLCSCAKNFQNQGGTVNHLAFGAGFKIALLHRGQRGIHHNDRFIMFSCDIGDAVNKTGTKKCWRARLVQADSFGMHNIKADGRHQLHRFFQHGLWPAGQRHGADIRMDHKCRRRAQNGLLLYFQMTMPAIIRLKDR